MNMTEKKPRTDAPLEVVGRAWQRHVLRDDDTIDFHAYTFCVLDKLQMALKRRDVFVARSWRYADPRTGLLDGAEWETNRPIICRTLGLSVEPGPTLTALSSELDRTYRAVAARLPDDPAVRFEIADDKHELVLKPQLCQSSRRPFRLLCQPASLPGAADGLEGGHGSSLPLDYKCPAFGRPEDGRRGQAEQHDRGGGGGQPDRRPQH
jgi:hypothetical protein